MSFPIGSGAVPSAPIEEPSMPSVPIGRGAFPTTSFDLPPTYSPNPEPFQASIHSTPIQIDACDLERNCYDRCYSESSCPSSEYRHHHSHFENRTPEEQDSANKCCAVICVLFLFILIGGLIAMAVLGVFDNAP